MATTSSADLLGTAGVQASQAGRLMQEAYDAIHSEPRWLDRLDACEEALVSSLAELRAVRWGVTRRMPQYDEQDLRIILAEEMRAIRSGHNLIPDQFGSERTR